MTLQPYNLNQIKEMLDNNKQLFESFFGKNMFDNQFFEQMMSTKDNNVNKSNSNVSNLNNASETSIKNIAMDMIQKKHEVILIYEIPGLSKETDVRIRAIGSTLIVEGEINRNYDMDENESIKLERKVGKFTKKVLLPIIFDKKRIHAKYKNGLLEIRVPILKYGNAETISVQFQNE